jgi:hypothetical protein
MRCTRNKAPMDKKANGNYKWNANSQSKHTVTFKERKIQDKKWAEGTYLFSSRLVHWRKAWPWDLFLPCVQEMVGTLCCVRFRDKRLKSLFVLLPVTEFCALEGWLTWSWTLIF